MKKEGKLRNKNTKKEEGNKTLKKRNITKNVTILKMTFLFLNWFD
jgi:hypothetical protein